MAYSKIEEFRSDDIKIACIAKALGHPARIAILKLLSAKSGCICGEIVEKMPLSQSTVSQHLQELKNAGLIFGNTEGAKVCYKVNSRACDMALSQFHYMLNQMRL